MAKRMPGIVVGARARKKAGLRYKLQEQRDVSAGAHVKAKADKASGADEYRAAEARIEARAKASKESKWGGRRFNKQTDPVKR